MATIGLTSSGPILGMKLRKMFRYGLVLSSMKPVTARSGMLYGSGRNCCTQESSVGDDQDQVDEDDRLGVVRDVPPAQRHAHPRMRLSEAATASRNASAAPASASASRPPRCCPGRRHRAAHLDQVVAPQDVDRAGERVQHEVVGLLLVDPRLRAGLGEVLNHDRQVGGRAGHERGGHVHELVRNLDEVADLVEEVEYPGSAAPSSSASIRAWQTTPLWISTATIGIVLTTGTSGNSSRSRATDVAPSTDTIAFASPSSSSAAVSSAPGFVARITASDPRARSRSGSTASPPVSAASRAARRSPRRRRASPRARLRARPAARDAVAMFPAPAKPILIQGSVVGVARTPAVRRGSRRKCPRRSRGQGIQAGAEQPAGLLFRAGAEQPPGVVMTG